MNSKAITSHHFQETLLVIPKFVTKDPAKLVAALEEHKIERLVLVPSLLKSILMYFSMNKERQVFLRKMKFRAKHSQCLW